MLNLFVSSFVKLESALADFSRRFDSMGPASGIPADDPGRQRLIGLLTDILPLCNDLNLIATVSQVSHLRRELDVSRGPIGGPDIPYRIRGLREVMEDELSFHCFIHVPLPKAQLYEQEELFGPDVQRAFGKAAFNIREAGSCLALDRYTAAVFHLMCVLEVGLDSLSYALGLAYSQSNWNVILQEIEKATNAIAPNSSPTWKEDKEFYGQAALEFRFFKDAWRNHTAHGRAVYTEQEAMNIFDHVKSFMAHLSKQLQQRP